MMDELNKYSDSTSRLIQELGFALLKEHNMLYPENVVCMTVFHTDDEFFVFYRVQPKS